MNTPVRQHDDWLDLLTEEATTGLSAAERAELEQWLAGPPDQLDLVHGTEAAVAAFTLLADADPKTRGPALPEALVERILTATPLAAARNRRSAPTRREWAGWWVAAASLLLAVAGWWPRLVQDPELTVAKVDEQRQALLQQAQAISASWSPGTDPAAAAVQGDVVFDPATQRGYLRFRGIPANDPRRSQYQLWIADAQRAEPQPVDGGLFNVAASVTTAQGDIIIPFTAKLPVGKPAAFVVTIEQPGGVVVSGQQRVLALAKIRS